jgi:FMN phosphatase YigB (HAD superfamily)
VQEGALAARLERAGILDLLQFPVFSSDYRSIKPSPVLFELGCRPFGVAKEDAVFVGDSLVNDRGSCAFSSPRLPRKRPFEGPPPSGRWFPARVSD